jgi:hypothetical protein
MSALFLFLKQAPAPDFNVPCRVRKQLVLPKGVASRLKSSGLRKKRSGFSLHGLGFKGTPSEKSRRSDDRMAPIQRSALFLFSQVSAHAGFNVGCPVRKRRDPQNHSHSHRSFVGDFGTRGRVPNKEFGTSRRTLQVLPSRLRL